MGQNPLRRKLAIATWGPPREGNIYGRLELDCTEVLAFLKHKRETTGLKVTLTHVVGKACADALAKAPSLNGVIRFGRFVPHKTVDIAYLVALDGGKNLGNVKVTELDKKPVEAVAEELRALASKLKQGKDDQFNQTMQTIKMVPTFLLGRIISLAGFVASVLGWNLPALGVKAYPFGSMMITNVGVFGLDEGFAPHTPFAHVPAIVLIGALKDKPVVRDGEVVIRPMLPITATIDHRYLDGAQGGQLAASIREVFADPWTHLGGGPKPTPEATAP